MCCAQDFAERYIETGVRKRGERFHERDSDRRREAYAADEQTTVDEVDHTASEPAAVESAVADDAAVDSDDADAAVGSDADQ